jgi:hypothetical protein
VLALGKTVPGKENCCKVNRIVEKYGISPGVGDETFNEQLMNRWLGEDEYPEMSLRQLVDWLHKHLLRTKYTESGRSTLDPHLESDYEALQNPESDDHHAVLEDLDSDGIDGEELLADFVSPATLYRHLTGCLGVEKEDQSSSDASSDKRKLEYIRNRAVMYVSDLLSAWENRGEVPRASKADVAVRIYLECPECAKQTDIRMVKEQGYVCEEHMSNDSGSSRRETM